MAKPWRGTRAAQLMADHVLPGAFRSSRHVPLRVRRMKMIRLRHAAVKNGKQRVLEAKLMPDEPGYVDRVAPRVRARCHEVCQLGETAPIPIVGKLNQDIRNSLKFKYFNSCMRFPPLFR